MDASKQGRPLCLLLGSLSDIARGCSFVARTPLWSVANAHVLQVYTRREERAEGIHNTLQEEGTLLPLHYMPGGAR